MGDLFYVYPKYKNVSFSKIARSQIAELKRHIKVQEIDEEVLDNLLWLRPRDILLHPVLYVTIGDRKELFKDRQKRLQKILKVKGKLGGFETADSDKIGRVAVDSLNKLDFCFLPSNFALKVFKDSGTRIPLHVLPHGISSEYLNEKKTVTHPDLIKIKKIRQRNNATLVLFFLLHSEYRKGADIVYNAMEWLQKKDRSIYLVVKKGSGEGVNLKKIRGLKTIEVASWLNEGELRQLYDVCDLLIVPSRGGGFELNALEGLARGLPTLVPNAGCFLDYAKYCVSMKIENHPVIFPDNPIHQGKGWEVTPDELADKINFVISGIEKHTEIAMENAKEVRKEYSWSTVCKTLWKILKGYGVGDSG